MVNRPPGGMTRARREAHDEVVRVRELPHVEADRAVGAVAQLDELVEAVDVVDVCAVPHDLVDHEVAGLQVVLADPLLAEPPPVLPQVLEVPLVRLGHALAAEHEQVLVVALGGDADQLNEPVMTTGLAPSASMIIVLLCRRPPPAW
jgi:hypothetical protein